MKKMLVFIALLVSVVILLFFANRFGDAVDGKHNVYAVLPLTGASSELGKNVRQAMDLYFESHPTSLINIVYVDSASVPEMAATAIRQKIINEENPIVISALSSVSGAVIPVVNSIGGFTFAILTLQVEKKTANKNYLRFDVNVNDVVLPNANYIAAHGVKSVTILFTNDEYGLSTARKYKAELKNRKVEVRAEIAFSLSDINVREVVAKALSHQADGVVVCGNATPSYVNIFRELSLQRFSGEIFADLGFTNPFVYKQIGGICKQVVFSCTKSVLTAKSEKGAEYKSKCISKGIPCNQTTVAPYDVLSLIESLLESNVEVSSEGLDAIKQYQGLTDSIRFVGAGECSYDCSPAKIIGEQFEIVPAK